METEIVGRDEELGVLARVLDRASEEPAACAIEGDAGVGKTALWTWAVAAAVERGYRVISARPAEAEASFSFSALGDLFRADLDDVVAQLPAQQRRALETALLIGDVEGASVDSHAVAVATLSAVELLTKGQPLVIAVDDVQWLDGPTRGVLHFVARRLPPRTCFLIAERVERNRVQFSLDGERIRVGPLSVGAMHRLVQQRLDIPLPRPMLLRLHETTGGNALYALEFARTLAESAIEVEPGEPLPVPATLREVVAQRLEPLSADTRAALLTIAASAAPTRSLIQPQALEEAARAAVLVVEGDRLRFAHPLFGSVLYADASPLERRDVHRRLASQVDDTEEAVRHLALSTEGQDESAARRLEQAAAHARARGAAGAAAELMEQAVELTPASNEADEVRRTVDAAEFHHEARGARAEPLLESVLPRTTGNLRARTLCLLGFHRDIRSAGGGFPVLHEALEYVDDPVLEVQIRLQLINPLLSMKLDDAATHAERAVELAQQIGDPALLASALASRANLHGDVEELRRAVELERLGQGAILARLLLARRSLALGDATEASALLRTVYDETRASGSRQENWAMTCLVFAEVRAGNLRAAKDVAERFLSAQTQEASVLSEASTHADRATTEAYLGEVEPARTDAETAMRAADEGGYVGRAIQAGWVRGFVELSLGDAAAAWKYFEASLARFFATDEEMPPGHWSRLTFPLLFVDATEALAELGRQGEATPLIEWLERDPDNPALRALAAYGRGLAAAASREEDRALTELADAVEHLELLSLSFDLARALLALGAAQRRAQRKREARETLGRALEIFERIETPLWAEKARRELARIGGRTASPGELTASEQRIAALVAEGKTNREVAAELFITVHTVEAALTRIYGKLGVRSRTELASRMASTTKV